MRYKVLKNQDSELETYSLVTEDKESFMRGLHGHSEVVHEFEVTSDEVKVVEKYNDFPSFPKAQGYFHEYLDQEYHPERWDDMTDEEYEIIKHEVEKGRQKCKQEVKD